jgi:hypothetical protein
MIEVRAHILHDSFIVIRVDSIGEKLKGDDIRKILLAKAQDSRPRQNPA